MGRNNVHNLSPSELVTLATQMHSRLALPDNGYGVSTGDVAGLAGSESVLETLNVDVESKKAAYHASIQARQVAQQGLTRSITSIARTVYANGEVTPTMIAALGLSPRSISRAKIVPQTPTGLTAALLPSGGLVLGWTGNNPYGVIYRIEAQVGSDPEFRFVTETTAQKTTLSGFTPGVSAALRVVASKNGELSDPSPVATAYHTPPAVTLRLAA